MAEEYGYLPEDWRRITRKADGQTYVSIYDGADESHEYLALPKFLGREWKFGSFCWKPKLPQYFLLREFIGGPGTDDLEATRYHGRNLWHLKDALGSTIALSNRGGNPVAKIGFDAWGNLRWPDKPGHHISPCHENDLDGWLDRLDFGRSFGFTHDFWRFGRHHGHKLTPYLYTGRRYEPLTQTYFNRNRYHNPKVGRFTSRDPIGFSGWLNLYAYGNLNPVRFKDPYGKVVGLWFLYELLKNVPAEFEGFLNEAIRAEGLSTEADIVDQEVAIREAIRKLKAENPCNPAIAALENVLLGLGEDREDLSNLGFLTPAERRSLQDIANEFNTEIDVVGSRAAGKGRNIYTNMPVGKGIGTRSDIDVKIDPELDIDSGGRLSNALKNIGGGNLVNVTPRNPGGSYPPVIRFTPRR